MTRNGGPEESATQVISTSGASSDSSSPDDVPTVAGVQPDSGPPNPDPDRPDSDIQQEQARAEHPQFAGRPDRGPDPGTRAEYTARMVPPRPDTRRPDPYRPDFGPRRWQQRPAPPRPEPPDRSRVRRARLRAVRIDPWSVMKTAFLLSIAFGICTVVSVTTVWMVLDAAGVYDSISRTVTDVLGSASNTRFNLEDYIGLQRVLGFTALICVVDVVLITAISTLCAFLYNLSASLLGGLEVTLAEED